MILTHKRFRRSLLTTFSLLGAAVGAGCASRQANLAELPPDDLFARATVAFEAHKWETVSRYLEFFVVQYIGDPKAADARMMLGDMHFARRDYPTAATDFDTFARSYPNDPRAIEARFKICDSYYHLAPRPPLDQEYTSSALLHCEDVATNYATSEYAAQADEYVGELRRRLATKLLETGNFYVRRRAYDAAVVYFNKVLDQFPGTDVAPAALNELITTYDRIGYVEEAAAARERLQREYPQSPEAAALSPAT